MRTCRHERFRPCDCARNIASFPCHWPVVGSDDTVVCSCGRLCGERGAKHPYERLAPNGCHSATIDVGVLKHWFGYVVPEANIAIHADGLVIVDVDPRHGGDESLGALEREHGELPQTWRVITGGGGEHVYFTAPDGVAIKNIVAEHYKPPKQPPLGPGIDIRTRGGYVITPPSRHMSGGRYEWCVDHHPSDTPLAVAPAWLVERLLGAPGPNATAAAGGGPRSPLADLVGHPITTYRDMAVARLAGHFFAHACDYDAVVGVLQAWDSMWCKPPLAWYELKRIIDRIAAKQIAKRKHEEAAQQGKDVAPVG